MVGSHLEQLRLGGAAVVDRQRARGVERTAGRQCGQRRWCAGYRHKARALQRVEAGAPSREALRCKAFGGRGTARSTDATSTDLPAYITSARSANSATTPRSCVMIRTPAPVTSRAVFEHVEDLRLHRDVQGASSARRRSADPDRWRSRWRSPPVVVRRRTVRGGRTGRAVPAGRCRQDRAVRLRGHGPRAGWCRVGGSRSLRRSGRPTV